MKKILFLIFALFLTFSVVGESSAGFTDGWSDGWGGTVYKWGTENNMRYFIQKMDKNSSKAEETSSLQKKVTDDIEFYLKFDDIEENEKPYVLDSDDIQDSGIGFNITDRNGDDEGIGGTFSTAADLNYFAVKSSGYIKFYELTGPADSYKWSTDGIGKEISHLSTWTGDDGGGGETPVPEPATMALLGIGLIGLAGISRRKAGK